MTGRQDVSFRTSRKCKEKEGGGSEEDQLPV